MNAEGTTSTVVKAPLVRASLVKRRYIKYLALPSFFLPLSQLLAMLTVVKEC